MKNYYYKIKYNNVVYDMIKYSLISRDICKTPTKEEVIACKENLRCIKDITDPQNEVTYVLIPMALDFSTPFVNEDAYTAEEMRTVLAESRWEHNQ